MVIIILEKSTVMSKNGYPDYKRVVMVVVLVTIITVGRWGDFHTLFADSAREYVDFELCFAPE